MTVTAKRSNRIRSVRAISEDGATSRLARVGMGPKIRELRVDDIGPVYHLGESVFTASEHPLLYRMWDPFEVAMHFASESDLAFVAVVRKAVVGFSLSTTVMKPGKPHNYGYLIWLGVTKKYRETGVGARLVDKTISTMGMKGVRHVLVDTSKGNDDARKFFEWKGFRADGEQTWFHRRIVARRGRTGKPTSGSVTRTISRDTLRTKRGWRR